MKKPFDLDERVVIRVSDRTSANGSAGWHGTVVGRSNKDDDPSREVLAYAVAIDEGNGKVWMVEPEDSAAAEG